jgi:L-alanine-DL-glutamate epimerase-like enolase superfamily enzyme
VTAIARIHVSHHRLPLDPPFPASWDPRPRTAFPATIVRVVTDDGHVGVGSGDSMHGFADYERWFIGEDPLDLDRHGAVLANIDFHAGRPWPLDVALWDLAGKAVDRPVHQMLGGLSRDRIRTYNTCAGYTYNKKGRQRAIGADRYAGSLADAIDAIIEEAASTRSAEAA